MTPPSNYPLDTSGNVAPLSCYQCSYDLRDLAVTGRCPECGAAISASHASRDWLIRSQSDIRWFFWGSFFVVLGIYLEQIPRIVCIWTIANEHLFVPSWKGGFFLRFCQNTYTRLVYFGPLAYGIGAILILWPAQRRKRVASPMLWRCWVVMTLVGSGGYGWGGQMFTVPSVFSRFYSLWTFQISSYLVMVLMLLGVLLFRRARRIFIEDHWLADFGLLACAIPLAPILIWHFDTKWGAWVFQYVIPPLWIGVFIYWLIGRRRTCGRVAKLAVWTIADGADH